MEPPKKPPAKTAAPAENTVLESHQLPSGVQLKTVHTRHSPLKKHIITGAGRRHDARPQILTVAVNDTLKVRRCCEWE